MNVNQQSKNDMLLQLSLLAKRLQQSGGGKSVKSMRIDNITGNLLVTYSDDVEEDLGRVVGNKGDDGVSILDVQLFEDELNPRDVFIQTTLSNGVVLRTRDSLAGYHGKSLSDAYVSNNEIHFVLEDGTELPSIPVDNLTAVSITGARIEGGDLIFTMSEGPEINAGVVTDLEGRGIVDVRMEAGKLEFQYTDSADWVAVGDLDGVASLAMVGGKLVYRKSSAPDIDIDIGQIVSITGAKVEGNELIFTTNQTGDLAEINVGAVANLKGDAGVGIKSVDIVSNDMVVTLTDDTVINIPVSGLTPIHIVGSRYDATEDEIIFELSDGSEISSGIKEDMRGAGVIDAILAPNGQLTFKYSDAPTVPVVVGTIKSIDSYKVEGGQVKIRYNTDPDTDVVVGTLLGIAQMVVQNGMFVVTYTDGSVDEVGNARSISNIVIDEQFNLVVNYTDGTTSNVGNLPKGEAGVGYVGATVDPGSGDLLLTRSDGEVDNAGQVRLDIDNMIGSINRFTAGDGQVEFLVDHGGAALIWQNDLIMDEDLYDLTLSDRIVFTTPLTLSDEMIVISFAPTGTVITGYGVKSVVEAPAGVYTMVLENGNTHVIDTVTVIPQEELPPGIQTMAVNESGDLQVVLTDGTIINAGSTNNANNTKTAVVDINGDLIITLDDDTTLNAGSVMSNLAISDVSIDANGDLIVTMNSGGTFNAGATGVYVVSAAIDSETGHLMMTLSDERVLDAGAIVNPLLGTEVEVTAVAGQTEIIVAHSGYNVLVFANAALLSKGSYDLSDPNKIILNSQRNESDNIRVVLMSSGTIRTIGLESEAAAEDETFYGKRNGAVGWYAPQNAKVGLPFDFVATEGQTTFNNVPHSGEVEIWVDGSLLHDGYTTPERRVILDVGLSAGQKVRVVALAAPEPMGSFLPTSYLKVANQVYTNGGSFVSGKWVTRQLNVVSYNAVAAMLQNNRMILAAGTYYVRGWAASCAVAANALKLYDVSSMQDLLVGAADYSDGNSKTFIEGYFTVANQAAVVLQHKCVKTQATYGLGRVGDLSPNPTAAQQSLGIPASLTELELWKVS